MSSESLSRRVISRFVFILSAEDWKAVNEDLQKSCRYVIKNLTTGDRLKIRVVALNAGGRSPPVALPEAILVKEVAGETRGGIKRETGAGGWGGGGIHHLLYAELDK